MAKPITCAECSGETIEFRGVGSDMQFKVCQQWQEPGHLTKQQISDEVGRRRNYEYPKGRRFA